MKRRRVVIALLGCLLLAVDAVVGLVGGTPRGDLGLVGGWRDSNGVALPDGTDGALTGPLAVVTARGEAHCEEQTAVVLTVAWPPGTLIGGSVAVRSDRTLTYVRDPDGVFEDLTDVSFEVVESIPVQGLQPTFRRWGNTLVVDPAGDAYVTRPGGAIERWARLEPGPACD